MELAFRHKFETEKLNRLYHALPESIILLALLMVIMNILHWEWIDSQRLFSWNFLVIIALLQAGTVYWLYTRLADNKKNLHLWRIVFIASSAFTGLCLGVSIFFLATDIVLQRVIIILIVVGVSASAVTSLGYLLSSIYSYFAALLLPITINYLFFEPEFQNVGILLLFYSLAISVNAYRHNKGLESNIRLRIEAEANRQIIDEGKQLHKQVFDNAPIGMVRYDANSIALDINQAFCKMVNRPKEEMIGETLQSQIADSNILEIYKQAVKNGYASFQGPYKPSKSMHPIWVNLILAEILNNNGERDGGLAIIEDITALRQKELELIEARDKAEKANQSKSDFFSNVSHELRTPMNSIMAFAELLAIDDSLNANQQDQVSEIRNAGEHLLALINEVLDLSRIESGRVKLDLQPSSIDDVIDESFRLVSPLAKEAHIELSKEITPCLYQPVMVDKTRIKQVFINLMSNAVKYNDKPDGWVKVFCQQHDDYLEVVVEDNGIGIKQEKFDQLFQPFIRVDTKKGSPEGSGIGLSICKSLIEMMEGEIHVDSSLNKGSRFSIWLALAKD